MVIILMMRVMTKETYQMVIILVNKVIAEALMEKVTVGRMVKNLMETYLMVIILIEELIALIKMREEIVAILLVIDHR